MDELRKRLTDKDHKRAYELAREIGAESEASDKYLGMVPAFAELLGEKSSYVRTRAFLLICKQARWANDGQLEAVLDEMLPLLRDPKPTVVRQCLNALREVLLFRPELSERIEAAAEGMDLGRYPDSMAPLIRKDVEELRQVLQQRGGSDPSAELDAE